MAADHKVALIRFVPKDIANRYSAEANQKRRDALEKPWRVRQNKVVNAKALIQLPAKNFTAQERLIADSIGQIHGVSLVPSPHAVIRYASDMAMGHERAITQSKRVFDRFGGVRRLHAALLSVGCPYSLPTLYKWDYPRNKGGTDGVIPTGAWADIHLAARHEGITLGQEEWSPRLGVKPNVIRTGKKGRPKKVVEDE